MSCNPDGPGYPFRFGMQPQTVLSTPSAVKPTNLVAHLPKLVLLLVKPLPLCMSSVMHTLTMHHHCSLWFPPNANAPPQFPPSCMQRP
jgi:hypothetical protein